jgi:hypothetical protein
MKLSQNGFLRTGFWPASTRSRTMTRITPTCVSTLAPSSTSGIASWAPIRMTPCRPHRSRSRSQLLQGSEKQPDFDRAASRLDVNEVRADQANRCSRTSDRCRGGSLPSANRFYAQLLRIFLFLVQTLNIFGQRRVVQNSNILLVNRRANPRRNENSSTFRISQKSYQVNRFIGKLHQLELSLLVGFDPRWAFTVARAQ